MGTRESNESNSTPVWFKAAFIYGPASAIAFYLVFQLSQGQASTLNAIRDDLRTHMTESAIFLRGICLNTAKDEGQRANCYPGAK